MKKLLLTTALVAATATAAIADGTNFNVALYGGYIGGETELNYDLFGVGNGGRADLGGSGGTIGLKFAYDYVTSNAFVIGADVFGAWHSQDAKFSAISGGGIDFKEEMKYSIGAAVKLGRMFDKTMAYGRIGYINSRFEITGIASAVVGQPSITNKKNLSGLLLGVGVDLPVSEKVAVGLSYDFALYAKKSITGLDTARIAESASLKLRTHSLHFSLKYMF